MSSKPLLGELLIKENLVSQDVIDAALRVQSGGSRRIGSILVKMKAVTADQMAETLAKQFRVPIIDIAESFSDQVSKIVPRYLCYQYGAMPLELKKNNILKIAVADPCDGEAIKNLENYTGMVVETCLARQSDIDREIKRKIPATLKDYFIPQSSAFIPVMRTVGAVSILLVTVLSFITYNYVHESRYGTISETASHTLFSNHDLTVGFYKTGNVSLLGHGAFSEGFYSVSFDNIDVLAAFVTSKKDDFSDQQRTWLKWAVKKVGSKGYPSSVASTN